MAGCLNFVVFVRVPARRRPGWGSVKIVLWVPSFSRARRSFLLFLGRLLCRRARYCSQWSFSGWPSFFMFAFGPAQLALGRPQDCLSAARSRTCRGLRGAAGGCMSAELGGAYFSSSFRCMLVVPRANHSFQHVFRFFRRRLESVCVCVCVCVCKCV